MYFKVTLGLISKIESHLLHLQSDHAAPVLVGSVGDSGWCIVYVEAIYT